MLAKLGIAALLVSLAGGLASADPEPITPAPQPPVDRDRALEWSVGGTLASASLIGLGAASHSSGLVVAGVLGSVVAPSFGEWTTGRYITTGLEIRLVSAALFVYGFGSALCTEIGPGCSDGEQGRGGSLAVIGIAGYAAGTIYDIATARSTVDSFNRQHALAITPTVLTPPSGAVYGVGMSGRF